MCTNPALCSKSVKTQQTGLSPPPPLPQLPLTTLIRFMAKLRELDNLNCQQRMSVHLSGSPQVSYTGKHR